MSASIWWYLFLSCGLTVIRSCLAGQLDDLAIALSDAIGAPPVKPRITWEMVEGASEEWTKLDASLPDPRSENLILYSAIIPFQKKSRNAKTENDRQKLLDEICESYKLFWPHYMENRAVGQPVLYARTPKCDLIFKVAVGAIKDSLTVKDFAMARNEIIELFAKQEYILVNGQIYDRSERLKLLINRFTLPYMDPLFRLRKVTLKERTSCSRFISEYRESLQVMGIKVPFYQDKMVIEDKIIELMVALEKSIGSTDESDSTDLSITDDLIKGASEEYKELSQTKKDLLDLDPRFRMVVDFAILPALRTVIRDFESFVDRLVEQYIKFRPGYVEEKIIGSGNFPENSDSFLKLVRLGLEEDSEQQPTISDFVVAKSEYDNWAEMPYHYTRESDVYNNLEKLERVMNLLNYEPGQVFVGSVYSKISSKMDPVEAMKSFRESLSGKVPIFHPNGQKYLTELMNALEEAHKSNSGSVSNSLTTKLIKKALADYEGLKEHQIEELNLDGRMKLIFDLAIHPMKRELAQGEKTDPKEFVDRLVKTYRVLRRAYVDRKPIGGVNFPQFVGSLLNLQDLASQKQNRDPTIHDFLNAKTQIDNFSRRLDDLRKDVDIYENLDEFKSIMNLFNYRPCIVFNQYIYPSIKSNGDFDPKKLLQKYRKFTSELPPFASPHLNRRNTI